MTDVYNRQSGRSSNKYISYGVEPGHGGLTLSGELGNSTSIPTISSEPTSTRSSEPTSTRSSEPTSTRSSESTSTRSSEPTSTRSSESTPLVEQEQLIFQPGEQSEPPEPQIDISQLKKNLEPLHSAMAPIEQPVPTPVPIEQPAPTPVPIEQPTPVPIEQPTPVPIERPTPLPIKAITTHAADPVRPDYNQWRTVITIIAIIVGLVIIIYLIRTAIIWGSKVVSIDQLKLYGQ